MTMRRSLSEQEFYIEAAKWAGINDPRRAKLYWDAFVETITREMFFCGSCKTPGLGTFSCRHVKETVQKKHDIDGKELFYYIPEHDVPAFKPDDDFINDINMNGVTSKYRTRLKNKQLNAKDKERLTRKQAIEMIKSLGKTINESERSFAADEFDEILRATKEEHERNKMDDKESE